MRVPDLGGMWKHETTIKVESQTASVSHTLSQPYDKVLVILDQLAHDGTNYNLRLRVNGATSGYTVHYKDGTASATGANYASLGYAYYDEMSGWILMEGRWTTSWKAPQVDLYGGDSETAYAAHNGNPTSPLTDLYFEWAGSNIYSGQIEVYGRNTQ